MTEDDYFYRQETRGEGGNDRVPLGEICLRRGDCRFHDGHHCFVYINDRIRSGNDRIRSSDDHAQTINNHDAFKMIAFLLEILICKMKIIVSALPITVSGTEIVIS